MDAHMDADQWDLQFRILSHRDDARSLIEFLSREPWPPHRLQTIGDVLIRSLAAHIDGVEGLGHSCVDELLTREWDGDVELAEQIRAASGTGVVQSLLPLPVDLDELGGILEGDPLHGGGSIDLRDGRVWPQELLDDSELLNEQSLDDGEDPDYDDIDRWLWVHSQGSHEGYRDMELFISQIDDSRRADRLSIAIEGHGAFRRFKTVLDRWPEEYRNWSAFSSERSRGRARAWLAAKGYFPVSRV
jgi:hypothetical protein